MNGTPPYRKRERHLGIYALSDILRICMEVPHSLDNLVSKVQRSNGIVDFKAKALVWQAMQLYSEFYGERALETRKNIEVQQSRGKSSIRMPAVNPKKSAKAQGKISLRQRSDKWLQTAKAKLEQSKVCSS